MDPEKSPLVPKTDAVFPNAAKDPRQWKSHWANPFGDFGAGDTAACCLALNVPPVAFGWNASRGLGLTWWKEALKFFILVGTAFGLVRLVLCVLVHTQCHPHAPHDPVPMMHALPGAVVGSDAYVPNNLRGHWTGAAAVSQPATTVSTATQTTDVPLPVEETDPAMNSAMASVDVIGPDANEAVEHFFKHDEHDDDTDDDDDDDDDEDDDGEAFMREFWHHHGPHGDRFHHHHDHMPFLTEDEFEECVVRIAPAASVAIAFGIALFIYAAYFAALRRQMIREKFGIEGSFKRDWLLWLGCPCCALTQETRTLMHNNVEEGLWHGPLVVPRQAVPMSA